MSNKPDRHGHLLVGTEPSPALATSNGAASMTSSGNTRALRLALTFLQFTQRLSVPFPRPERLPPKATGGDARWLAKALEVVPELRKKNLECHPPTASGPAHVKSNSTDSTALQPYNQRHWWGPDTHGRVGCRHCHSHEEQICWS